MGTLDSGLPSCRFHASSSYARTASYWDSQGKSSSLLGQMGFDERTRGKDLNAAVGRYSQQVPVTTHNLLTSSGQGTRQKLVVLESS